MAYQTHPFDNAKRPTAACCQVVLKRVNFFFFSKMSDYFEGLSNKAKNRYKEKLQAVDLGIQDDSYKPENGSRRKTSTSAA